jgi:hypothetical protein
VFVLEAGAEAGAAVVAVVMVVVAVAGIEETTMAAVVVGRGEWSFRWDLGFHVCKWTLEK